MSEEKTINGAETEFAFVIVKHNDGRLAVGNVEGDPPAQRQPTLDDIYSALCVIKRDLETQNQIAALVQVLGGGAQGGQPGPNQQTTEGGLVVPSGAAEPVKRFQKVQR